MKRKDFLNFCQWKAETVLCCLPVVAILNLYFFPGRILKWLKVELISVRMCDALRDLIPIVQF